MCDDPELGETLEHIHELFNTDGDAVLEELPLHCSSVACPWQSSSVSITICSSSVSSGRGGRGGSISPCSTSRYYLGYRYTGTPCAACGVGGVGAYY